MTGLAVWLDGELVPASAARIPVYDRAFRSGEGVFETLRVYDGYPFRLREHVERAVSGASELGFAVDGGTLDAAVRSTVAANLAQLPAASVIRVTVSAGSIDPDSAFPGSPSGGHRTVITQHRLAPNGATVTAVTVPSVRELARVKSTSYLVSVIAQAEAVRNGADTALLTDRDGRVTEAASANVFAVVDGRLVTPPTDGCLLPGITRGTVIELARLRGIPVTEKALVVTELARASEAMLSSSVRGILGVTAIDGITVGAGVEGPVTRDIRSAYADLVAQERAADGGVRGLTGD